MTRDRCDTTIDLHHLKMIWRRPMRHTALYLVTLLLCCTESSSAQQQFYDTVNVNGVNRQFLIYLPTNFDPDENMPVLFHFHGGDGSPELAIQYEADYRTLANLHRFIAVYPSALVDNTGCTCWNNEGPFSNGIDELGFADAMIDAMTANYNANPDRIYASGYSLGGSMMWDLACYRSDRFAAIGVVAANMWQWTYADCAAALPTGICHILGTNDFYAPYNGNQYSISVSDQNAHWVDINQSDSAAIETPLGGGVTRFLWPEGNGCHTVMHYRRQNAGHDWPSFATQSIWEFVSEYESGGLADCLDQPCTGDITGDNTVNVSDVLFVIENWGSPYDVSDMLQVIGGWGPCT